MHHIFTWYRPSKATIGSTHVPVSPQDTTQVQPKLPPELERVIFLYAYSSNPEGVRNLFSVARRVEEWVGSLFFKVVLVFQNEKFPVPFTMPTFLRYGKYIRHLAIDLDVFRFDRDESMLDVMLHSSRRKLDQFFQKVIRSCSNLVDLCAYNYGLAAPTLSPSASLTHLAITLPPLFQNLPQKPNSANAVHRMFPGITHLQAVGCPFHPYQESTQTLLLATHFPNLTHLAMDGYYVHHNGEFVRWVLTRCRMLEMVVIWWNSDWSIAMRDPHSLEVDIPVKDGRIVHVYCDEKKVWQDGAKGEGLDIWQMAERRRRDREMTRR